MGETALAIAAIVSAGAAVTGTVLSTVHANKAAAAQRRLQQLQATRQKQQQIREARIRRGQVANIAGQTGTGLSSAALGAEGSIQSQLATNLSFLDQSLGIAQTISKQQSKAQTFGAVAGLGGQVFSAVGGTKAIKDSKIFS